MTAYEKLLQAIADDKDEEIIAAVKDLKATDGSMISHDMLVRIAKAMKFVVKEQLPDDVKSNFWFIPEPASSDDSSDDSSSDDSSDDSSSDDSSDS